MVTLTSGNTAAATVPASVTVAEGATTANFAIATTAVTTSTSVNLSATYSGASKVVTLVLNPPDSIADGQQVRIQPAQPQQGSGTPAAEHS